MGIGFALGGIAKGITGQQDLAQKRQALALQTAEMQNNNAYRNASLGMEQKRLDAETALQRRTQAMQTFNLLQKSVSDTISSTSGQIPPDKVMGAIQTQVNAMKTIAPSLNIDPSIIDSQVQAALLGGSKKMEPRLPVGYEQDPNNPGSIRPMAGGPGERLPQQEAGILSMIDAGQKELDRPLGKTATGAEVSYRSILSDPSKWTPSQQLQAVAPKVGSYFSSGDVVNAQGAVKTIVEGALRMMTGAAAPQQEVDRYALMFTPTVYDSKETASAKMRRLDGFVSNARKLGLQGRGAESDQTQAAPTQATPSVEVWGRGANGQLQPMGQ